MKRLFFILLFLVIPYSLRAEPQPLATFTGQIDISAQTVELLVQLPNETSISLNARKLSFAEYALAVDINHLKTPANDFSSHIASSFSLIPQAQGFPLIKGKMSSQYSLLDYKPIQEFSGEFEIKEEKLTLKSLDMGNLLCRGTVDLMYPYKSDIVFNVRSMPMEDFINFWTGSNKYDSQGDVTGEIKAVGNFKELFLKGRLVTSPGSVETLNFNEIQLNASGIYPKINIEKSLITKSDGMPLSLGGSIDLSDHKNFKRQIKALSLAPIVTRSDIETEWMLRRVEDEGDSTTEIKYFLRSEESKGKVAKEEPGIIGVERTVEF